MARSTIIEISALGDEIKLFQGSRLLAFELGLILNIPSLFRGEEAQDKLFDVIKSDYLPVTHKQIILACISSGMIEPTYLEDLAVKISYRD